jgi:endonuclease/exonuclease/phosphatase family metal-dependent hydrolase
MPEHERNGRRGALRVATYNIHKGVFRGMFNPRRLPRIHELQERVHGLQADLVFLQEVQGRNERHAARFEGWPEEPQGEFLARAPRTASGRRGPGFESAYGANARYLHGHHGNALLSRFPIEHRDNLDVSDHALESRGILHCIVRIGARRVHCFVVHFGLLGASRARQLEALIDWIGREVPSGGPLIIAGDFNDWRNRLSEPLCERLGVREVFDEASRVAVGLRAPGPRMRAARTFPALAPWLRMDRIYQRGFEVTEARVLRGPQWARLSDHSPLVADLRVAA